MVIVNTVISFDEPDEKLTLLSAELSKKVFDNKLFYTYPWQIPNLIRICVKFLKCPLHIEDLARDVLKARMPVIQDSNFLLDLRPKAWAFLHENASHVGDVGL